MKNGIASSATEIGRSLTNIRLDEMISKLGEGIALGQLETDKLNIIVTKMMGVPGIVNLEGNYLSMLESGFIPTFYQFINTVLELKIDINVMRENTIEINGSESLSNLNIKTSSIHFDSKSINKNQTLQYKQKINSAYTRIIDTSYSQKYSNDLSASSLMRTNIKPIPVPDSFLEYLYLLNKKTNLEI